MNKTIAARDSQIWLTLKCMVLAPGLDSSPGTGFTSHMRVTWIHRLLLYVLLAGCAMGETPAREDFTTSEGEKNLAAIRAVLSEPSYSSMRFREEVTLSGSMKERPRWPPDWLSSFSSPHGEEKPYAEMPGRFMPGSLRGLNPSPSSSHDLHITVPWKPVPSSLPPAEPFHPVPPYTTVAPPGPPSVGGTRCVPDFAGGQRCRPN